MRLYSPLPPPCGCLSFMRLEHFQLQQVRLRPKPEIIAHGRLRRRPSYAPRPRGSAGAPSLVDPEGDEKEIAHAHCRRVGRSLPDRIKLLRVAGMSRRLVVDVANPRHEDECTDDARHVADLDCSVRRPSVRAASKGGVAGPAEQVGSGCRRPIFGKESTAAGTAGTSSRVVGMI